MEKIYVKSTHYFVFKIKIKFNEKFKEPSNPFCNFFSILSLTFIS